MPCIVRQEQAHLHATRGLPIPNSLVNILQIAGDAAGLDEVVVFSGGQPNYPAEPRVGSKRHDIDIGAADVNILKDGEQISFEDNAGRLLWASFITACAANGATGIGAAFGYMGWFAAHIGFGDKAYWGDDGLSIHAPSWLIAACQAGWLPHPAAHRDEFVILKAGDQGDDVKEMQAALNAKGATLDVDGDFGGMTLAAVKAFQAHVGFNPDGECGPRTWTTLKA